MNDSNAVITMKVEIPMYASLNFLCLRRWYEKMLLISLAIIVADEENVAEGD